MPIERLDAVLQFIRTHQITNTHILSALSDVPAADFDDFKTLLQNNTLAKEDRFPYIFAHMPKDKWSAFTTFVRDNALAKNNIIKLGLVYAKQSEENWKTLLDLTKEENLSQYISDYVINRLSEIPPEEAIAYLTFIEKRSVTDWEAKNALFEIQADKRDRLWAFATQNNLVQAIDGLAKISDPQWGVVTRFILTYSIQKDITSLASLSAEEWERFERFVSDHQMSNTEWITTFATVPAGSRKALFRFQQEYKIEPYQQYVFNKISANLWPQFITTLKAHGITDTQMITRLAQAPSSQWEPLVSFIKQENITDRYTVRSLIEASPARFQSLLRFIEEYNLHDEHIIYGLACIPAQHWENIMALSEPLLRAPLLPEDRGVILIKVYEITNREYRIDREMPVYGEAERRGRIAYAVEEITNGRMPQRPSEYSAHLQQILRTPLNQRLNMAQAAQAGATAIDVHADGRDDATTTAVQLFKQLPYDLTRVNTDYEAFTTYINAFPQAFTRLCVQLVIGLQVYDTRRSFAPISPDETITSHNLNMTGREFFARLWHFIHEGTFEGVVDEEALNKERENARIALVRNIADAYEEGHIVCNSGKIQRIMTGVFQGRLPGVHVDREIPIAPITTASPEQETTLSPEDEQRLIKNTVAASLRDFLQSHESTVNTQQALRALVEPWLQNERGLQGQQIETYKRQFQEDLNTYLALSELPEQDVEQVVLSNSSSSSDLPEQYVVPEEVVLDSPEHNVEEVFNTKKKEIQTSFVTQLKPLHSYPVFNKLNAAQKTLFEKLKREASKAEVTQAINEFKTACTTSVNAANKIMGPGWLSRIVEVMIKAIVGLFASIWMILGAVIGRGILSATDRSAFRNTFFTLKETDGCKALRQFEESAVYKNPGNSVEALYPRPT